MTTEMDLKKRAIENLDKARKTQVQMPLIYNPDTCQTNIKLSIIDRLTIARAKRMEASA